MGGLVLFGLPLALVLWLVPASRGAREQAHAFMADLRAGRQEAAMARTTPAFREALARGRTHHDAQNHADTPDEVFGVIRHSTDATFTGVASGWSIRCLSGSLTVTDGPDDVCVEMVEEDGRWRVDGVNLHNDFGMCDD